jgi:hypothetical protein
MTLPYFDTMMKGISCDLQYWKNSKKPESSLMSGRRPLIGWQSDDERNEHTISKNFLAILERVSVLANALQHLPEVVSAR